jgi:hypothetical protein
LKRFKCRNQEIKFARTRIAASPADCRLQRSVLERLDHRYPAEAVSVLLAQALPAPAADAHDEIAARKKCSDIEVTNWNCFRPNDGKLARELDETFADRRQDLSVTR